MTDNPLYAKAHKAIEELLPTLKGENVTREQWWRLLNINLNDPVHIPFKKAVNEVLYQMSTINKKKKIEKNGTGYRVIDEDVEIIDFKGANIGSRYDLVLPFGIHEYCYLYPKNIMIVYGGKDSGKTAWCLNIVRLNMKKHPIVYFSSEMGATEMANRLLKYKELELDDWDFEPLERSYDFHQVIRPDSLNIVDYLELGGDDIEYFKAVAFIRKIYDSLNTGVAIIALQKNANAEYPKGGTGALEKARLALSLDSGKVSIAVGKNWTDDAVNPKGKAWTYKLVGGINIVNPQPYYGDEH